jgi:hypothetical protein
VALLEKQSATLEATIDALVNDTIPDTSYLVDRLASGASSCSIRARSSGGCDQLTTAQALMSSTLEVYIVYRYVQEQQERRFQS